MCVRSDIPMRLFGRNIPNSKLPRLLVMGIAGVVLTVFVVMVCSNLISIWDVRRDIKDIEDAKAQKESELSQLEQRKAYYESDAFFEDAARSSGYVGEDETVFQVLN